MIDEELKEELRKEIRAIIKDEIINILFEKKFKDSVKSYVNTIIDSQIENRKLKKEFTSQTYVIDPSDQILRKNSFSIKTALVNKEIHRKLIKENKTDTSYDDFVLALTTTESDKFINWIHVAELSKEYQVGTIFTFLTDISLTDLKNLNPYNRKKLINFVVDRFCKDSKKMIYHNVNKSFTEWKKK